MSLLTEILDELKALEKQGLVREEWPKLTHRRWTAPDLSKTPYWFRLSYQHNEFRLYF